MMIWYKKIKQVINIVPGGETENNTQNPEGVYTAVIRQPWVIRQLIK